MTRAASSAHTERETKLAPHPGFDLSNLAVLLTGSTISALSPLDLRATYFDTAVLTLARAGITLRHRTGDGPPTWTVKLPAGSRAGTLVRRELNIEGARNRRPRQVTTTVAAHLRGRRLVPVAELRAVRTRVAIGDEAGNTLVEVADDLVTATRGRLTLASWEEIEVEAIDSVAGIAAQRHVVRALRKAGCGNAASIPKLVRALGEEAAAAPDVTIPDLPRHPGVIDAVEHALARSVVQMLDHDPAMRLGGDPEDLHRFRVATRRLRSDLRTFRHFLDAETTRRLRGELRWVADQTNQLRDLDVLGEWLRVTRAVLSADDQRAVDLLVLRCDEQAARRRAALLRLLGSPRYLDLVRDLVNLLETPPDMGSTTERRARRHLRRQVRRRWADLEAQVGALGDDPACEELHQARIAAKRCRAAVEAIEPLAGHKVHRLAESLAHLQDVLGAVHDASVIESWLRRTGDSPAGAFVAGELAAIARADGWAHTARLSGTWAKVQRRHDAI